MTEEQIPRGFVEEFVAPIAKEDWLDDGLKDAIRTFQMALDGQIPDKIKGWMLTTSCMRVLRSVFGDDLTTVQQLRDRVMRSEEMRAHMERKMGAR